MNSVREDLGYLPKEKWFPLRIPFSPIVKHQHEPESVRLPRKQRNYEAIFKVSPEAECLSDGSVKMILRGYAYTLWPSSDVYLMEWNFHYETGIESLCERLLRRLSELKS